MGKKKQKKAWKKKVKELEKLLKKAEKLDRKIEKLADELGIELYYSEEEFCDEIVEEPAEEAAPQSEGERLVAIYKAAAAAR